MNPDVKDLLAKLEALRREYYPILRKEPHGSIGDAVLTVLDTIAAANQTNTLKSLPQYCAAFALGCLKPSDFGLGGTKLPKK